MIICWNKSIVLLLYCEKQDNLDITSLPFYYIIKGLIVDILFLRKLHLKVKVFFNAYGKRIKTCAVNISVVLLLYFIVNSFIFAGLIMGFADASKYSHEYGKAISMYNLAGIYYKINHFSAKNKSIYFEIPYDKAVCYWEEGKKPESTKSMLDGIAAIQNQYGQTSVESAYFIRRYLIDYYLYCDKERLAELEFNNLLNIYKSTGYTTNDLADLVRLSGDLHYKKGQYDKAMDFYKRSYNAFSKGTDVDYDVFVKIVKRIAAYEAKKGNLTLASSILQASIETLKNSGKAQNSLTAELYLYYGDVCDKQNDFKGAVLAYEDAIKIIRNLPETNYLKRSLSDIYLVLKRFYGETGQYTKSTEVDIQLARKRRFHIWF